MNTFQTSDSDLATYLYARAYPLVDVWRVSDLPVSVFPQDAQLSAQAFYHGASVPAKDLLHASRQIQSIERNTIDICRNS
jgi:hypothetical protein